MDTPKRILVFGGSFSPPTLAHEAIMRECLALPDFDAVWVLPSGDRRDKTIAFSDEERLQLLNVVRKATFHGDPRLVISDFELQLPRPTQTAQTVAALQRAYPDAEFWFVFGADSYLSMPEWEDGAKLQQTLNVILLDRGASAPLPSEHQRLVIDTVFESISATRVREALAAGQPLTGLVSETVATYIAKRNC